ncbi:hypothetical protein Pmani_031715 [Petrolisthes manimaculis]|uniref:Uncharacterized protein n=1 Tax=Petrolisthes manimaculis TaxID=1843537 RepID=A0AAE1NV52_9EUCA|nr:hypothetical protein Pmani_031715 [Petrolisthes manimaculis]
MASRRKRYRESIEADKTVAENDIYHTLYNMKRKKVHEDVEEDSDNDKLLKSLNRDNYIHQKANTSYCKLGKSTTANTLLNVEGSCSISNFRSRVTKTYASPKRNVYSKTDEVQQSSSNVPSLPNVITNNSENSQDELKDDDECSEETNLAVSGVSLSLGKNTEGKALEFKKSLSYESAIDTPLKEEDSGPSILEHSGTTNECYKPMGQNTEEKSSTPLMNEQHHVAELSLTNSICNKIPSTSSNIPVTYSYTTISPVLQPMYGAGVPSQLSHQYVTSAIAAVSTPIPTVPILPEIVRGTTGGTKVLSDSSPRQAESRNASPSKLPSTSDNQIKQTVSYSNYDSHCMQGNNLHVYHYNFNTETDNAKKDIVCEENDADLCENTALSVIDFNCEDDSLRVKDGENTSPSKISKGVSTSEDFIQIENWGTYLLQKLEVLYEQEQECDLILKFWGGETLKVHRAIVLACTSLVSGPDAAQCRGEYTVPSDLNYSHVEPVIRFVYSGRFDIEGPQEEVAAIYSAARRLQVPLLTRLMDSRFPHLTVTCTPRRRLPIWKRNPKFIQHNKEYSKTKCNKIYETGKKYHITTCKSAKPRSITVREVSSSPSKETEAESVVKDSTDNNEIGLMEEEDGSMYLVLQKGKNIVKADAVIRSRFAAERARPTRFELEEDSEHSQLQIATWSSKASSMPTFFSPNGPSQVSTSATSNNTLTSSVASSLSPFDAILATSTPVSHQSTIRHKGSAADHKNVVYGNQNSNTYDDPQCDAGSYDQSRKYQGKEADQSDNEVKDEVDNVRSSDRKEGSGQLGTEVMDTGTRKYAEFESKFPSVNESCTDEDDSTPYDYKVDEEDQNIRVNTCRQVAKETKGDSSIDIQNSVVVSNTDLPAKSILKKKKDKNPDRKEKKHVSFPLDENNEVINEVATYSHVKEPAQSLIEVKKNIGSLKSSSETGSPVKLTLSMKKKTLMNISLDESDPVEVTTCEKNEPFRKYNFASKQSSSQDQASKGDLSGHAKIISEVLKKYPNLVKDKKNVRLKILKKGNDKNSGGKGTKSKVQYLVLSEGEMKGKSGNKHSKTSAGSTLKQDSKSSKSRAVTASNRFECPECEKVFQSYFNFKNHVSSEHKDHSSTILAAVENVPFACYTCFLNEPLEFNDYFSYQQHMQDIHSNTETRVCNICGFRPKKKLELAYHQYSEHNKVPRNFSFPKCDLCDFVAMNDASLLKHRSQHANADSYTCSVCGVTFCSFGALQGHMQTKLCQSKPTTSYKCPHCPLTFARSYNLKAHCKSSHRSIQTSVQVIPGVSKENKPKETVLAETRETDKPSEVITSKASEEDGQSSGNVTTVTSQSSSEAEALSTVASSLAASLGLPEETVSQYMYTQGCTMSGEKVSGRVSGNEGVSIQLVEATPPVSGYQEEHTLCHDVTYTTQATLTNSTNVSALYPVSVVSNQVVGTQIVPGQIPVLSSQVLQGGCISTTGGSILGSAPHSWAYVTYQMPAATSDDLPTVMTEAASMNAAPITSNQEVSSHTNFQGSSDMPSHQQISMEISDTDKTRNDGINNCEQLNSLVVVTNTSTQMENISQPSVFL